MDKLLETTFDEREIERKRDRTDPSWAIINGFLTARIQALETKKQRNMIIFHNHHSDDGHYDKKCGKSV